MSDAVKGNAIDRLMERASRALSTTDYFEAESLSARALEKARRVNDFDRMARILLPLQEARRQIRDQASDCGVVRVVERPGDVPEPLEPGCYLVQPPMIGLDARTLWQLGLRRRVPLVAMAREPLTRDGRWPIVAVSEVSVRAKVETPAPIERVESRMSKDEFGGPVPVEWFIDAYERLGDAGIASVDAKEPAAWRVDDLLERLSALPFHEKLHQALASAARQAMHEPLPEFPRRRPPVFDPNSF
ncbi:MAG: hypothetical protein DYG94_14275 [Leptolyngbya sp. PLA3]|nr:MAG: hypothetical protein EDM82_13285 [Cyanobacteria bacterium CYA]MCE7969894.1 hypothetical protein [Leptolyngbya sp. PL-A3]